MSSNIYYNPKESGLVLVGEVDEGGSYEFDIFAVWRRASDGKVLYGTDSGCSCPVQFEDVRASDLIEVDSYESFSRALDEWSPKGGAGVEDLRSKVRAIFAGATT